MLDGIGRALTVPEMARSLPRAGCQRRCRTSQWDIVWSDRDGDAQARVFSGDRQQAEAEFGRLKDIYTHEGGHDFALGYMVYAGDQVTFEKVDDGDAVTPRR